MTEGAESHAAYGTSIPKLGLEPNASLTKNGYKVWTCVGTLAILDRLDIVDRDALCWWLSERQLPEGGLNGRPQKLQDVRPVFSYFWIYIALTPAGVNRSVTAGGRWRRSRSWARQIGSTGRNWSGLF
jgi:hypothetical protein